MPPLPSDLWIAAERALIAGEAPALEALLREYASVLRSSPPQSSWCGGLAPDFSAGDVRTIIAREHHFPDWAAFAAFQEALKPGGSPVLNFEVAADAVVSGHADTLASLLRQHPELIRARSMRRHQATLLHYVGANGVEGWRQRTPPNAVKIADMLLRAGAEVDAVAAMYGGSTTLGLVATSIHPLQAGVQRPLMALLLDHGAAMDAPGTAGNGQSIVNGCLANGRPGAAEFLAHRGARLDLEGAAGVGRLEVVHTFFGPDGRLGSGATQGQLKSGLQWACEYGRIEVVRFLLARGARADEIHRGQTALHWAAYGGFADLVALLLRQDPPPRVNVRDEQWHNTPLGWALHGWAYPSERPAGTCHHEVVASLVAAGGTVSPGQIPESQVAADPRMAGILGRRTPCAL